MRLLVVSFSPPQRSLVTPELRWIRRAAQPPGPGLPLQAPPFDKIKDADYQPAIEAGREQRLAEMMAIAENPAPPTFENTLVAMEKAGQLSRRVQTGGPLSCAWGRIMLQLRTMRPY